MTEQDLLAGLDEITRKEIETLLEKYTDTRAIVEYRLKKFGALDDAAIYENYDDVMSDLSQTKEIRRRRAIAQQIKDEHISSSEPKKPTDAEIEKMLDKIFAAGKSE